MLVIYEIELPRGVDAAAFAAFMTDEFVPAVHKGATRVGQVQGVELLERNPGASHPQFRWLMRWSGAPVGDALPLAYIDDDAVRRKFQGFGATMKEEGSWQEVVRWPAVDA